MNLDRARHAEKNKKILIKLGFNYIQDICRQRNVQQPVLKENQIDYLTITKIFRNRVFHTKKN